MGVLRTSRSDPAAEPAPRSRQAVSPAPVLPAASLLGLQRTAGNAAVARYVNQLRRKPVEAIDATSDQFWDQLADAADKQLSSWLSFSFGGALNQFHLELTSGEAEDGTGSFVLDTCVTLLGFGTTGFARVNLVLTVVWVFIAVAIGREYQRKSRAQPAAAWVR